MVNFNDDVVVKEIKRRLSIIDLIESYTSVKRAGKGYVGLCPFHDDHNPSMHVDEEKGLFHCFSCGVGGDILGFYMRYNNTTFPEAVAELAKRANITIEKPVPAGKDKTRSGTLLKINTVVSKYYQRSLLEGSKGEAARGYLNKRGIRSEIIEEFSLGYAPPGWDNLVKYLTKHKVPLKLAEKTGLLVKKNSGEGYYDRFRNRVMFPIKNVEGKVVGFGGRVLEGDEEPKYINSPESEIYHKRSNFYGLDRSREHIRRERRAVIVEGYMDFLSLYSAGIRNVVATLGTSLTRDHVSILKRYTDRYVVVFDGDESGIGAAVRSLDTFLEEGLLPNVVILPEGMDPDTYLTTQGRGGLIRLIEGSSSLLDLYIENTVKEYRSGDITLTRSVREIAGILVKVNDPILRSGYIRKTAEKLGIRENEVLSLVKYGKGRRERGEAATVRAAGNHEKLLLTVLLKFPELSVLLDCHDLQDYISDPDIMSVLEEIVVNGVHDASSLIQLFQNDVIQGQITEALFSSPGISDRETAGKMIERCIRNIKLRKLDDKLKVLRLKIDEAVRNKDFTLEKQFLKEYSDLMKLK